MDLKKLSHLAGYGLVLLAFSFLAYLLSQLDFSALAGLFQPYWIAVILFLSFLFSLLYFFMAEGWRMLLSRTSQACLSQEVLGVYLKTVIFKYAPGNVFHFLGRHSLQKSEGISHESIAFANGIEILMQLFAVSVIIMIGTEFFDITLDFGDYVSISSTKVLLAFSLLIGVVLWILSREKYRKVFLHKEALFMMGRLFLYHLVFLLGSATLLVLVYIFLLGVTVDLKIYLQTVVASSIAWLLGFVVPGAPGGVGIREAILALLLPTIMMVSKELVLAGALTYRVVTILGEALTYFWAKLFLKK